MLHLICAGEAKLVKRHMCVPRSILSILPDLATPQQLMYLAEQSRIGRKRCSICQ